MEYAQIVRKLIGKVNPVGETNTDNERFENLKELCALVETLLMDINDVAFEGKDAYQFSIKRASDYAKDFLKNAVQSINQN